MLNVPDGSSLECLWGVYLHKKFPEESTPRGGGADWDAIYGAVNAHHNGNLSAFLKSHCQHSKMLDAEYQKNAMGRFKFNKYVFKKKRKLDKNLKNGLLEW